MINPVSIDLTAKAIGVKKIPTDKLIPNPHNPRMLFDKRPMGILEESIGKVGILVPLTVYWSERDKTYIILDGQRRWICAQKLNIKDVPVNQVAEPTLVQNIVTMFQIHKLREDWELMPTALKVEVLIKELKEKNEKKLAELTGLDQAVIVRCQKLLSYPKKYQDLMLDPDPEKRVKPDFFIELFAVRNDKLVNEMEWFSKERFTQRMLEKYQTNASGLKAVTDFRIMKQHISNARKGKRFKAITKKLKEFTEDDSLTLDHLIIEEASVAASARKLLSNLEKLETALKELDVENYYSEEKLWLKLEGLLGLIKAKLSQAGRRSKE